MKTKTTSNKISAASLLSLKSMLLGDVDKTSQVKRNLEGEGGVCITASGNILESGNISLKLFMALLERIKLLTFW